MTSFNLVFQMTIIMLTGILMRKLKVVDKEFGKNLSSIIFNLALPCLVLTAFTGGFAEAHFEKLPRLLALWLLFTVVMYLIGLAANKIINKNDSLSRSLLYGTITPNITFIGLPLVNEILGAEGVIYFVLLMIPMRVFVYVGTPLILQHPEERISLKESIKANWRNILNPATIAIPVSIIFYFLNLQFPTPIQNAMLSIASMTSPLGMLLCGILLAELPFSRIFEEYRVFVMAMLRNFIAPAAVFLVLYLLNVDELLFKVSLIYCSMPIASTMAIYSTKFDCDGVYSSMSIFISTLLSVGTIPLWMHFTEAVF